MGIFLLHEQLNSFQLSRVGVFYKGDPFVFFEYGTKIFR